LVWIVRAFAKRKFRAASSTISDVDDFLLDVARRTKLFLLFVPAVFLGMRALEAPDELRALVKLAAKLSFVAQVALWSSGVIDFFIRRHRRTRIDTDPSAVMTMNVFRVAAIAAIWVFAVIAAIQTLGFNVTTLIAGLGIGGVAVALATQNILGDLFASLSIVVDKPFVLGDSITVDSQGGTVEHIGLKTTRMRAPGGEELIIANGDLLKSRIRNFRRMSERRSVTKFAIAHGTDAETLARIPALLQMAVENQEHARFDRAHFVAFGDAAYEFELSYFVTTPEHSVFMDVQHAVNLDVVRAFAANGVALAHRTPAVVA
ncbi:MAG TPA: mechanosensitive ion channel family protein, partial [Thermoanaerobaculia bacterium]